MKIPRRGTQLTLGLITALVAIMIPAVAETATFTVCASSCDQTTIQAAVTAAAPGDTITVAPGTYPEDVTVNKALTINGARAGVDARTRTGAESVVRSFNIGVSNVVLDGLSLSNYGVQVRATGSATALSGVVIRNSIFDGYNDVAIVPDGAGNIIIQKNLFRNPAVYDPPHGLNGAEPMQFHSNGGPGGCTGTQVLDNKFDHATTNGSADINFSCTGSNSSNVTVSGNVGGNPADAGGPSLVAFSGVADNVNVTSNTATTSGSQVFFFGSMTGTTTIDHNSFTGGTSSAVALFGGELSPDTPSTGTFYVSNNNLSGNNRGVRVTVNGLTAAGKVVAYGNNLSANTTAGVENLSPGRVSATNNWWGSASGPSAGAIVGSNVSSVPSCLDATCSTQTSTFENATAGSPNGQSGWKFTGTSDVAMVSGYAGAPAAFGSNSIRISNAVVTGGFSDQLFSLSLGDEAGESSALNGGQSGGTRRNNFSAEWQVASATPNTAQPGLAVTVSPDRGDGSRMSFIRMRDETNGLAFDFVDTPDQTNPADFVETTVASGLDRTVPHTVKLEMIFNEGADNDLVLVFIDGNLLHIGTSWENYFRFDDESNPAFHGHPSTVDSLIFRLNGTPQPGYSGKGFLVDNVKLGSKTLAQTANLASLSLSSGTLSPAFNPSTTAYTANVINSVSSVTVTGTTSDGSVFGCGSYENNVVPLSVGNNAITCTVVSQDLSTVKTYTITVNRAAPFVPPPPPPSTTTTTSPPTTTPPVSTPPVTAPTSAPTAPVVAPVKPGQSGSIQVTTPTTTPPAPATGTGGSTPPTTVPPEPAKVEWKGDTFPKDKGEVTVKVDPKPVLVTTPATTPPGGGTTPTTSPPSGGGSTPPTTAPPTQVGNGLTIGAGNAVLEISATGSDGQPITQLTGVLNITLPANTGGDVPAYSRDQGKTWVTIPKLSSPELPPGQSDGYFVNPDGSVTILTRHLTYFVKLNDGQAPTLQGFGAIMSSDAKTVRFVWNAKDNIGVEKYVLAKNGRVIGVYKGSTNGITLSRSDGNYAFAALDAGGNITRSSIIGIYGSVVDITPPPVPQIQAKVVAKRVQLSWAPVRDQTKVTYLVFRDGAFVAEVPNRTWTISRPGSFTVDAIDQAGYRTTSKRIIVSFDKRGRPQIRT